MSARTYSRRKKRPATTSLEDIEEEIGYSEGLSGHEEQEFISNENLNSDAIGTDQGFVSGNDTNSGAGLSSMVIFFLNIFRA